MLLVGAGQKDITTDQRVFFPFDDIILAAAFQQTDFKEALLSSEAINNITDRIVLSRQDAWGDQLAVNVRANDPFERRESLDWFGTPIGTPIETNSGWVIK